MSSNAWETTSEDVENVIAQHRNAADPEELSSESERVFDELETDDFGRIEKAVLYYTDFNCQVHAALNELEDILMEKGVISGEKQF